MTLFVADELKTEQDHAHHMESGRKQLESQLKELQVRLDEAEAAGIRGGKRAVQKMETRVS